MLGEPLGKMLCEGLVIFENTFRIFIDQIFGESKSDWNFLKRFDLAECRIRRPTLWEFGCGENWATGRYACYAPLWNTDTANTTPKNLW